MAKRELIDGSIEIAASPAAVWAIVSDLPRMGEWSPQCRRMTVLGGTVREGATTLNLNRRGPLWWPTTSKVVTFEPERRLAFVVPINGTTWTYELEATNTGTHLRESREVEVPGKAISNFLIKRFMGGMDVFEAELERGIATTLARVKREAEAAPVPA